MSSPVDVPAHQLTCPRCNRPKIGLRPDGRLKSHRHRVASFRCPGSSRLPENARMRVSPLKVLGVRERLTAKERTLAMEDALAFSSAIEALDFTAGSPPWRGLVEIRFAGSRRSYSWRCGVGGWILLWKCYRITARANEGRFSLGRAVNRWRDMPSIKRAAAERQRQELAEESPDLVAKLEESLEVVVDPFALSLASEEQTAGDLD